MTIRGTTFDLMQVSPSNDSLLFHALGGHQSRVIRGYRKEMAVTSSGLNVYIDLGAAAIMGRLVEITDREMLTVKANSTGHICVTIDLSKNNTATGTPGNPDYKPVNNQVRTEAIEVLTQQDILGDGKIYTFPIASYKSTTSGVTVTNTNGYEILVPMRANFEHYPDNSVIARRTGDLVTISGAFRNKISLPVASFKDAYPMGELPVGFRPAAVQDELRHASGTSIYNLHIDHLGVISAQRHQTGGLFTEIRLESWLTTSICYHTNDL